MNRKAIEKSFARMGAEIVDISTTGASVKIFLRVADEKTSKWPMFIQSALLISEDEPPRMDISKVFVLREGKVIYLWRVVIATGEEELAERRLVEVFSTLAEPVTEVTLTGASPRNAFWAHDGRAEQVIQPHFFAGGSR